jgi:hypothetical protein
MNEKDFILTLRETLTRLDKDLPAYIQSQGEVAVGAQAAIELASYKNPESLHTVFAIGKVLLEFVGEHVSAFIKTMHEPVETLAGWTCVRSMFEASSIAAWLFESNIDAHKRISRAYAYRYDGLEEQLKFARSTGIVTEIKKCEDILDKIEQTAVALGFPKLTDKKGNRIGLAERMPTATEIIKAVLDEEVAYRVLSAVAHAHFWALHEVGFRTAAIQPPQTSDGLKLTALEKAVGNPAKYAFIVVRAMKSITLPVWRQSLYFGWDKAKLVELLESIYDQMEAQPAIRFWR